MHDMPLSTHENIGPSRALSDVGQERARGVRDYILGLGRLNSDLVKVYVPEDVADEDREREFTKRVLTELTDVGWRIVLQKYDHIHYAPQGYLASEVPLVNAGWARMDRVPVVAPREWGWRPVPYILKLTDDGVAAVNGLWHALGRGTIQDERARYVNRQWQPTLYSARID